MFLINQKKKPTNKRTQTENLGKRMNDFVENSDRDEVINRLLQQPENKVSPRIDN